MENPSTEQGGGEEEEDAFFSASQPPPPPTPVLTSESHVQTSPLEVSVEGIFFPHFWTDPSLYIHQVDGEQEQLGR